MDTSGTEKYQVLNLWTCPRSLSTALTMSFAQRPDTKIFDEPIMSHFLRVTGKEYTEGDTIGQTHDPDGEVAMQNVFNFNTGKKLHWVKNMPHNWVEMDNKMWFPKMDHLFLLRKTEDMVRSYTKLRQEFEPSDLGYKALWEMYNDLNENYGYKPLIIKTEELQDNPELVLKAVCAKYNLEFYPQMLSWTEGGHQDLIKLENSWYGSVTKSTGWKPYKPNSTPIPEKYQHALEENLKYYFLLEQKAPSLDDLKSGHF